jgi:peptidoglycan/LPS O-acetylase OafA/YrhL
MRSREDPTRPVEALESGTLDGDHAFRGDVEGLRALAVALVILAHAAVPGFSGGFVGVDVFYVISGFVITGVLLRRIESTGRLSFLDFYGRRARRILPAAGLVLLVTVVMSYHYLGFLRGAMIADDARWASTFLANVHFAARDTNYFGGQFPPSPLQNYWSLSVEEQFYLIYPLLLVLCLRLVRRGRPRTVTAAVTAVVIVLSLTWSIHATAVNSATAYFSSATRAWELALGGFISATTHWWRRLPPLVSSVASWVGLVGVGLATVFFSSRTSYPGDAALLPVLGAGLVIVGGAGRARGAAAVLLARAPARWVGKISYSLYLWSWPLLTLATQNSTNGLSLADRALTILGSLIAASATYYLVENPLRRARLLVRYPWWSLVLGLVIIAAVLGFATYKISIIPAL